MECLYKLLSSALAGIVQTVIATMQTVRLASYSWLFRPYEDPVEGRLYPRKVLA